jgi:gas vesicle protein
MPDSHDRGCNEAGGVSFIMGLLTGTILGVGLGMLLAPKRGVDLRGELGEQARTFGAKASERYQRASETASTLAERGREIVNQAREAVNRGAEGVRTYTAGDAGTTDTPGSFDGGSTPGDSGSGRL